jgi:bifunctional UDP-N-acetylglucosamine pyrophosphorylase/glucosamine-1-phosphate N-acetyltransferase
MRAVILAAGKGRRLEPLTNTTPKGMLPLAGRPLLEHILDALSGAGIDEATVVVGYRGEAIREYLGEERNGVRLSYATQRERLGTAHALAAAGVEEDVLVLNGDTLVSRDTVEEVLRGYRGADASAVIALRRVGNPGSYGAVFLEDGRVTRVVEKPGKSVSPWINAGIYVFSPGIVDAIDRTEKSPRGEYELTSSINLMIQGGEEVRGVEITGLWEDVGTPWSYLDANRAALELMDGAVEGEVEVGAMLRGKVFLGKGSVIRSGSYVEGPVYIGRGCVVGPNAFLRSYATLGDRCRVGSAVEIKNSILMEEAKVPHLSYVGDSIIGRGCNLGAGTKVGNLRLDGKEVKMRIKGELLGTGRRKFGCVLGDNVKTGLNVMINAGRKIGNDSMIGPGVVVYHDVEPRSFILHRQDLRR